MSVDLGSAHGSIDLDLSALRRETQNATSMLQTMQTQLEAIGARMSQIGGQLSLGLTAPLAALGAVGVGFQAMQEQAQIAFTTLLGSGEEAAVFLEQLQTFADKTPFEFPGLRDSAQKLLAVGFAGKDVLPILTAVGNATAGLGGGTEMMQGLIVALGQIQSKGKASAEEIGQIAERGVPAWQFLAKALNTDVATAMDMVSKGAVDADTAIAAILAGMQGKFGGLMDAQSKSLLGLASSAVDAGKRIAGSALAPLAEGLRVALASLTTILPQVRTWLEQLPPPVLAGANAFGVVLAAAGPLLLILGTMASALAALLSPLGVVTLAVAGMAAALASGAVQLQVFSPILDQLSRIASLVGAVFERVIGTARDWGEGLMGAYADGIAAGVGWVADALQAIGDMIAYWLQPGSPPPLLPDIDEWGTGAGTEYVKGFSKADLTSLADLGGQIEGLMRGLVQSGQLGEGDALTAILGTQDTIASIIQQLATTGSVTDETFAAIRNQAGPAGAEVEALARAFVAARQASDAYNAAQSELTSAQSALRTAQVGLASALSSGNPALIAEQRALVAAAQQRKNDAAARAAAAKNAQSSAQAEYDRQQALLAAQKKQNDLLAQQIALQEKAAKASTGGGGGGGGGASAAKAAEAEAQRAAAAQRAYEMSLLSSQERLVRLREELAQTTAGSAEYYQKLGEIQTAEQQANREQEQAAAAAARVTDAQAAYAYSIADTAGKLDLLRAKQQGLSTDSAEYWQVAQQIAQLEAQQAADAERAAKSGAKGGAGGGIGAGAAGSGNALKTTLDEIRQSVDAMLAPVTTTFDAMDTAIGNVHTTAAGLPAAFAKLPTQIGGFLAGIITQAGAIIPQLIASAGTWVLSMATAVQEAYPQITSAIATIGTQVIGALGAALPGIISALGEWIMWLAGWAVQAAPGMLAALGAMLGSLLDALGAALPGIVTALAQWADSMVRWVIIAAPPLFAQLLDLVGRLLAWLSERIPLIAAQLAQWAMAFVAWIGPMAADLLLALGGMVADLLAWIIAVAPDLIANLLSWGSAFVLWVGTTAIPGLLAALGTLLLQVGVWIVDAAKTIGDKALSLGSSLVDGMRQGISDAWKSFVAWLKGLMGDIPDAVKVALGIKSPSTKMRVLGKPTIQGFALGMQDALPLVATQIAALQRMLTSASYQLAPAATTVLAGGVAGAMRTTTTTTNVQQGDTVIHLHLDHVGPIATDIDISTLAYRVAKEIKRRA